MHRGIPLAIITLFAFFENDGPAMLLPKLDQILNFIDFLEVGASDPVLSIALSGAIYPEPLP